MCGDSLFSIDTNNILINVFVKIELQWNGTSNTQLVIYLWCLYIISIHFFCCHFGFVFWNDFPCGICQMIHLRHKNKHHALFIAHRDKNTQLVCKFERLKTKVRWDFCWFFILKFGLILFYIFFSNTHFWFS